MVQKPNERTNVSDLHAAVEVARLLDDMEGAVGALFVSLHDRHGYSWTEIADALGMTRQGARQRFVVRPAAKRDRRGPTPGLNAASSPRLSP